MCLGNTLSNWSESSQSLESDLGIVDRKSVGLPTLSLFSVQVQVLFKRNIKRSNGLTIFS